MKFTAVLQSVVVDTNSGPRFCTLDLDAADGSDAVCLAVHAARMLVVYRVEYVGLTVELDSHSPIWESRRRAA